MIVYSHRNENSKFSDSILFKKIQLHETNEKLILKYSQFVYIKSDLFQLQNTNFLPAYAIFPVKPN